MGNSGIRLLSASAGSGKTYSLALELVRCFEQDVRPEGVVATTFTNKAASELVESVRLRLLESGRWKEAQRVFDGYMGTVNSVCGRLLKDFAIEAGLSPTLDVLPEGEDEVAFQISISPVIEQQAPAIDTVARRLGFEDWRGQVKRIIDLARSNGIAPDKLAESSVASWNSIKNLLPKPLSKKSGEDLDEELFAALGKAAEDLSTGGDGTKKTKAVLDTLKGIYRRHYSASTLSWADWERLRKLAPAVKSREAVEPVVEAAALHPAHPRFQQDIKELISLIFSCSAEAMEAFAAYKKSQGLIDFVDQEALSLRLLGKKEVRETLEEALDVLFVDEFQDTSPIQLALFLEFAKIAGKTIWVGDQKQSIYGFRGTDPMLMDSVIEELIPVEKFTVLGHSWRSRPELVRFTSTLFAEAFKTLGVPEEMVRLSPKREDHPDASEPILIWGLDARNIPDEARALANGVVDLIERAQEFQIHDKETGMWRPLRGGDVAVLCRTNHKCSQAAEALEECGLRAAISGPGLLSRPECILSLAALRYLVDPGDTVAVAEILHFSANGADGYGWFEEWVRKRDGNPFQEHPLIQALDGQRTRIIQLTPSESLELAMETVGVSRVALGWGDVRKRLSNLDMLLGLTKEYENYCLTRRAAATAAGLLTYLNEIKGTDLDKQAEGRDEHAVQVLTYHKAKGLEWPVVILVDLHTGERSDAFGVHISSPREKFDARKPLAGRKIRFWPWPYEKLRKIDWLEEVVSSSEEYGEVALAEKKEMMRLLYVGMTRARDYLVLAARSTGKRRTDWLDQLRDTGGKPILDLPEEDGLQAITISGESFVVKVTHFAPEDSQRQPPKEKVYSSDIGSITKATYPPAGFSPTDLELYRDRDYSIGSKIDLGNRIALDTNSEMVDVGQAIHGFLAADRPEMSKEDRSHIAARVLQNWQVDGLKPESLVLAADRLQRFVEKSFGPDCIWHREWPIHLKVGDQKSSGWIDLLVETPDGYVIIDHKGFPGSHDDSEKKALEHGPQLARYKDAIEKATGRPVLKTFIHMPVVGNILEIKILEAFGGSS